ncbi:MAG: nicotinamide mononucleotide transporter [Bacteroidales bacterium]|nr:nicotinamide mononucleotide transporter [Bacteroidales bacterium]MBR3413474.1 nicotinamide mononucleotide transporter [Bacteroidales bacterium]
MKRIDLKRTLYNEFVAGQTVADGALILCGLLLQLVAYWITGDSLLSLITGMLGVFSVTLCSQRRVSSFLFGIFQITCYMVLAARQHFFGELVENGFYLLTTLAGIYTWTRNYDAGDDGNSVQARRLSAKGWTVTMMFFLLGVAGGYWLLRRTSDPHPLLDTVSSVPAFVAQLLMMLRYREQWIFWIVVDVIKVAMWVVQGDWCMAAQFSFWVVVCIYGLKKWK